MSPLMVCHGKAAASSAAAAAASAAASTPASTAKINRHSHELAMASLI